jgi:hypothetical protein
MVHICVVQEVFSIVDELVVAPESMPRIFERSVDVEPVVVATKTGEQSPIDIDENIEANLARL